MDYYDTDDERDEQIEELRAEVERLNAQLADAGRVTAEPAEEAPPYADQATTAWSRADYEREVREAKNEQEVMAAAYKYGQAGFEEGDRRGVPVPRGLTADEGRTLNAAIANAQSPEEVLQLLRSASE